MKQNERLLVYAVTGFLALILVIAVLFGNEPAGDRTAGGDANQGDRSSGNDGISELGKLLGGDAAGEGSSGSGSTGAAGDPAGRLAGGGEDGTLPGAERPLVAKSRVARDIVAQQLGPSRRDRTVRLVRAKSGDSFSSLAKRWCGSAALADDVRYLNETVRQLQVGQEVSVPWVDDEELLALIQAQQPRVLTRDDSANGAPRMVGTPMPASARVVGAPDFRQPRVGEGIPSSGVSSSGIPSSGAGAANAGSSVGATVEYTIKSGDSLWKIAAKKYGNGKATKMANRIQELNGGLSAKALQVGKKILLPVCAD